MATADGTSAASWSSPSSTNHVPSGKWSATAAAAARASTGLAGPSCPVTVTNLCVPSMPTSRPNSSSRPINVVDVCGRLPAPSRLARSGERDHRQSGGIQADDSLRSLESFQAVAAEVHERPSVVGHEIGSRRRQQDVTPPPDRSDSGGAVYGATEVVPVSLRRRAAVQAHPHMHSDVARPRLQTQ